MTNYSEWDSKTSQLLSKLESEDKQDEEQVREELGQQEGRYPRSEAEASELTKAAQVLKMKEALDAYKAKEEGVHQTLSDVWKDRSGTRTITRKDVDKGRRVLTLSDSTRPGTVVLSEDLTQL